MKKILILYLISLLSYGCSTTQMPKNWPKNKNTLETWQKYTKENGFNIGLFIDENYKKHKVFDEDNGIQFALLIFEIDSDPYKKIKEMIHSDDPFIRARGCILAGELGDKRFYAEIKALTKDKTKLEDNWWCTSVAQGANYSLIKMFGNSDLLDSDFDPFLASWLKKARKIKIE